MTACGSSSTPAPRAAPTPASTSPSATPAPPAGALTSDQLGKALISVADLPKGYTEDTTTRGTTTPVSTTDGKCAKGFRGLNELQKSGPLAVFAAARVSFSKSAKGPFVRVSLGSYASQAKAARVLASVHAVFAQCPHFQFTNPQTDRVTAVRLSSLKFARVGQEGVATAADLATANGPTVRMLLVFVRQGQSVAYVAEIASGATDTALLERAVRAQIKKLPI
jgi:hypothetical protein